MIKITESLSTPEDCDDEVVMGRPPIAPPEEPITKIETFFNGSFALGDTVYYIAPGTLNKIKRSTIKQFVGRGIHWIFCRKIVLRNDVEVQEDSIFHTIAEARSQAIKNLTIHLIEARNQLASVQHDIRVTERLIANLKSYENKDNNNPEEKSL